MNTVVRIRGTQNRTERFLEELAGAGRPSGRAAVVVAHPDDETIGIGGSLHRLADAWIVHLTDGAPADMADASAHGFATRGRYARARRAEARTALALAGIPPSRILGFGVADQAATWMLPFLARRLAAFFAKSGIAVVLTHPFEGGHPDHDAASLAVHAACALLARADAEPPAILEMAFYHDGESGLVTQRFPDACPAGEWCLELAEEDWLRKQRMLAAFATQQQVLSAFRSRSERLRPAPRYDFSGLPNKGRLHYERSAWGMTGTQWQSCAAAMRRELGLGARL
jgi:N-acetylglucosamine malate deacetylase 2